MTALLIVDLQNDFLPGGALAVKEGDAIIPVINKLMLKKFDYIVASKDWHPASHGSFAATHHKQVGEHIELGGVDQILWPVHCVQKSHGSEFPSGFFSQHVDAIIYKGTDAGIDSYSAFFDNGRKKATGLEKMLVDRGITTLYIAGLATDYCVKFSVLDALKLGFKSYFIEDASRGVNLQSDDTAQAIDEMRRAGAGIVNSEGVFNFNLEEGR